MNVLRTFRIGVVAATSVLLASCGAPKFGLETNTQGLVITVHKPVQQPLSIQSVAVLRGETWTNPSFQVLYAQRNEVALGTKGESDLRIAVPGAKDAKSAQVTYRTAPGKPLKTKVVQAK